MTANLLQITTILLRTTTAITNCDKFITNYDSYYKLRQLLQITTEQRQYPKTLYFCIYRQLLLDEFILHEPHCIK